MTQASIVLGTITLQPGRQLLAKGVPLAIGRKPLEVLSCLAAARGDIVTKDELINAVWANIAVEDNALQAHIVGLRKLLGPEAWRLQTVRGFGYRLNLCEDAEQAQLPQSLEGELHPAVAVLPFVNLSDDPDMEYLGDGLAEEIISSLARTRSLSVPARTSTFAYKNRYRDVREIARELGVGFVLEGSVRRSGEHIRLTAQLIEAGQGFHLWADHYDCAPDNIINIQEAIAQEIASRLQAVLLPKPASPDPDAFDLCLRARSLLDRGSSEDVGKSVQLFQTAVARDPNYAGARTGLSRALVHACSRGVLPVAEYREALFHALKACHLDPDNAGAQAVAGCSWARMGDWLKCNEHLQRAFDLHEQDADFHCVYGGGFLLYVGHLDAALRHARRARELTPASAVTHLVAAFASHFSRQHDQVERHLAKAIELGFPSSAQPIPAMLSNEAILLGDRESATLHAIQTWRDVIGPGGWEIVPAICGGEGKIRADAIDGFRALLKRSEDEGWAIRHGVMPHLFGWALLLGERELVRAVARQVLTAFRATGILEIGAFVTLWVLGDETYLDDPAMQHVFQQTGLAAYWDIFGPPEFARRNVASA